MNSNSGLGISKQLETSFFKRKLPESCVAFASEEGKQLFKNALNNGYMENYFGLSLQFTTQSEPAYCGLATLAMVLNSMEIDPNRQWKGVWRWYSEELLECCRPLSEVKVSGITLTELTCLARCNGLQETTIRVDEDPEGYERFLDHLKRITSGPTTEVLVLSYDRSTLGQTGSGHFSPVGSYDPISNKVLILDVARFKYPAHWVSAELVWKSMFPVDPETGRSRGYMLLKPVSQFNLLTHALIKLSTDTVSWPILASHLFNLPAKLERLTDSTAVIEEILEAIPPEFDAVADPKFGNGAIFQSEHLGPEERASYSLRLTQLLKKVVKTELYKIISTSKTTKSRIQSYQAWQSTQSLCVSPLLTCTSPRDRRKGTGVQVSDYAAFLTLFIAAFLPFVLHDLPVKNQVEALLRELEVDEVTVELQNLRESMKALNQRWKESK
jgi:hypothetical protein